MRAGHSSAAFTLDRYRHLYHDQDGVIADRLDDLLGQSKAARSAEVHPLGVRGSDTEDVSIVCSEENDEPEPMPARP